MVGPLYHKDEHRTGGFLRPNDDRDRFVTEFEVEVVIPMKVKPLYTALHDNLNEDGWVDPVDGGDKFESLYWERILDNGMKEHHIWWRMVKYPNQRSQGFGQTRWACKVDFQTLAMKPTEIAYKGKKVKADSVDLIIRMWFYVQWDWENKFKDSWIKGLQHRFQNQLFRRELDHEKDKLLKEAAKIHRYIKTHLDLEDIGEQRSVYEEARGYQDQFDP